LHTTWRDISDRKAAEAALAEKEAQYRSIFEAINDGVFISDLETGNLVTVNPAACEMHGHDYEEFITLAPPQYIHPDSLCLFSQFLEMSRTGKRFFCEAVDVHKDGTLIDVEVTAVPFLYGNKPHILSLVRDIRDRKRTETTLQQKAQELEQALQDLQRTQLQMIQAEKMSSLGQLVAGIAHEINNPVNFIYGNIVPTHQYTQDLLKLIELYQRHYPNPVIAIQEEIEGIDLEFVQQDLPKILSSMRMGADRIRQIVSSLRTFSRLDEAEYKEVNLHEGIDSTLVILESRLKRNPTYPEIQVVRHYGDLPLIECYAGQLNQVFLNILTNAIDALEERDQDRSVAEMTQIPSTIRISTKLVQFDRVVICIADNALGIPVAVKQQIFDPFFTTKPVGKGTGMGMSISYQIITENHRGSLKCFSTPGRGAKFVIEIPLWQQRK
jgi:PAS domain S-box-containing protein